jgi:hypothetical protein
MADSAYSFSLTTFNPSGKLLQIEYALNAVNSGGKTSLGIKCTHHRCCIEPAIALGSKMLTLHCGVLMRNGNSIRSQNSQERCGDCDGEEAADDSG